MRILWFLLSTALLLAWGTAGLRADDTLRMAFSKPPASARILKIIHSWPDAPQAQDSLRQTLKTQGFGGVVCNVAFQDYLQSETRWHAFQRAVREAKKDGFAMWLYDEKGYPSGTAGGLVLKDNPQWQARGLLLTEAETAGNEVTLQVPPGELRLASAFPVLDGAIQLNAPTNLQPYVKAGTLRWKAPEGQWHVMALTEAFLHEGTHADMSLADHIPYPNLLEPAPTARFIELTHAAYSKHLPEGLNNYFEATFTDEPSLMSLFLKPMPYRVIPWSPGLEAEFSRRRGAALGPRIPALFAQAGPGTSLARYQFWQTVGELVAENFFGQIQDWCNRERLPSGGHLLMEENLVSQVPLYGDFFACLRRLDAPSIDCLTSIPDQVPWFIGRMAASAALLEGKRIVMCETSDHSQHYRPAGDNRPRLPVSRLQIRGTCNRLMVSGVNAITSYYSFAGLTNPELRELNDWVGRCCAALAVSRSAPDIAVLFPVESLWPRFVPSRHFANASPDAARIESVFHSVSESLYGGGWDFSYVDGRTLTGAEIDGSFLIHRPINGAPEVRWKTVVLPAADTLPLAAWEKLAWFARQGGTVICVGARPANSELEFPSIRVEKLATELLGVHRQSSHVTATENGGRGVFIAPGEEALLPGFLEHFTTPSFRSRLKSPLRYTRRQVRDTQVFFVVNDSARPWKGEVEFAHSSAGQEWNPGTGKTRSFEPGSPFELDMQPYDARLFVFENPAARQFDPPHQRPLPQLHSAKLASGKPAVSRGEFVSENLREPADGQWEVTGVLTRSGVDTFLFTRFEHATPPPFEKDGYLVLETTVPAGQRTPTQLLVILHEKGGADYLATTGRWLNTAGTERSVIPLSRFALAGWSSDANNSLDLKDISEVRIGWGGYYGESGERVTFTISNQEAATHGKRDLNSVAD